MSDYICPYLCSYRTNSGFCGYTGGHDACQWRKIKGFDYETKQFYAEPVGSYEEAYNLTPKTNADRIRRMSDEELAKFITELLYPVSNNYSYDIWAERLRVGTLKWLRSGVETK